MVNEIWVIIISITASIIITQLILNREIRALQTDFMNILKETTIESVRLGLSKRQ